MTPTGEPRFQQLRPQLALPSQDLLALEPGFALHPALAPLLPLWSEGSLAFVHAVGSPDPTRSHFDAQDFLELGTPAVSIGFLEAVAVSAGCRARSRALPMRWPGLDDDQLYEGRDLAVTTDLRSVLAAAAARQLGATDVQRLFPGFSGAPLWSLFAPVL